MTEKFHTLKVVCALFLTLAISSCAPKQKLEVANVGQKYKSIECSNIVLKYIKESRKWPKKDYNLYLHSNKNDNFDIWVIRKDESPKVFGSSGSFSVLLDKKCKILDVSIFQ